LLVVSCVVAWLVVDWLAPLPDLMAMRRVQPGMTEDEVVAVFGARPTKGTPREFNFLQNPAASPVSQTSLYWYCDAGIVCVVFGPDGRVKFAHYVGYRPSPNMMKLRTFLDRIGIKI
jgi:hypothetical protein